MASVSFEKVEKAYGTTKVIHDTARREALLKRSISPDSIRRGHRSAPHAIS